ncbi:hypothetical protein [Streptomyces prasinus]|uniref:hypothetical protein n=1 Tax=Streptomyces prasinus TaxID=67345 RepID=UPI000A9F0EDE|nr:hypothetical protein [Streptomyces prasinus]
MKILEAGSGVLASDPYQTHGFTALFTVLLAGLPALIGLVAYLASRLMPERLCSRGLRTPAAVCRDLALLCSAAALALYMWGCLHLLLLDRQGVGNACAKQSGGVRVAAFHGDFVPLRMVCRTDAGSVFTVVVPDYVNPSVAVLLLLVVTCATAGLLLHRAQPSGAHH